jgi:hypothetical protein
MLMFIHGLKYVIPCPSRFSRLSADQIVTQQYESILATVKNCLRDHWMSITDDRAKEAFDALNVIRNQYHRSYYNEQNVNEKLFVVSSNFFGVGQILSFVERISAKYSILVKLMILHRKHKNTCQRQKLMTRLVLVDVLWPILYVLYRYYWTICFPRKFWWKSNVRI